MQQDLGIGEWDIDGGALEEEKYAKLVGMPDWMLASPAESRENAWAPDPPQSEPKRLAHVIEVPSDGAREHLLNAAECLFREAKQGRRGLLVFEGLSQGTFPRLSERFLDEKLKEDWIPDKRWRACELGANPHMIKWKKTLLRSGGWSNQTLVRGRLKWGLGGQEQCGRAMLLN